tara:strand:- start:23 stop:148 length:126 start_codon:yes stop_codon:yes gene_type:complete
VQSYALLDEAEFFSIEAYRIKVVHLDVKVNFRYERVRERKV